MKFYSFENIPSTKTPLEHIIAKAQLIFKLNCAVKSILPKILSPHLRIANYRHDTLIIEVSNATWLMRLRYEQSDLLSILKGQLLPKLNAINFKINPNIYQSLPDKLNKEERTDTLIQKVKPISLETALRLRSLGENSSTELRKRLNQLADLAQPKNIIP